MRTAPATVGWNSTRFRKLLLYRNFPWEQKIVDKREDDFAPTLSILIRDKESKKPVQASLTIEGSREIDALYIGSDLFFNISRNHNIIIKCDVEGYFFEDRLEKITAFGLKCDAQGWIYLHEHQRRR